MRIYPKIDTLFLRDKDFKLTEELRNPVVGDIGKWIVTEKIDGTNIRVSYERRDTSTNLPLRPVEINGRSDNAQIPGDLVKYLIETFTSEKMNGLLLPESLPGTRITLFGEGYGGSIQKGSRYGIQKRFILFDVLIEPADGGAFWQSDAKVTDIADMLNIDRVAMLGSWTLGEIVERVRAGVPSVAAPGTIAEGIVARPRTPLFDQRGNRLILKLKTSDFK